MPVLVVGRDRAHVRELLARYPLCEIISASLFFDRVRLAAFFFDEELSCDDQAPLFIAYDILAQGKNFPLHYAPRFLALYNSLFHGTVSPHEAYVKASEQRLSSADALHVASLIDEKMREKKLSTQVSALFSAWQIMQKRKFLPPALAFINKIIIENLIDMTLLEAEVIKSLAELGLPIEIHFPLDFKKRSFNVAVDYAARLFERNADSSNIDLIFDELAAEGPLKPLVEELFSEKAELSLSQEHCEIVEATSISDEAYLIAQKIAEIKSECPKARVALAVRALDERALVFKRSLLAFKLSVKDRKGSSLAKSPVGRLLHSVFAVKSLGLTKRLFLELVHNPLSLIAEPSEEKRIAFMRIVDEIGLSDSLMPRHNACQDLLLKLERLKKSCSDESLLTHIEHVGIFLAKIDTLLQLLVPKASLKEHLHKLSSFLDGFLVASDPAASRIKEEVAALYISADKDGALYDFADFIPLISGHLEKVTLPAADSRDAHAIDFLLLPELMGRTFDYVFIADICLGRLPEPCSQDLLISDEQRKKLNQALGKDVLRIFLEDPFEPLPVPPRQALEPFWFASAIASAEKKLHFSYAKIDNDGKEQSASDFFLWLKKHVLINNCEAGEQYKLFHSYEQSRFIIGAQSNKLNNNNIYFQAFNERKAMFAHGKPGSFALQFEQAKLQEIFAGRLDSKPSRAISPSLTEAFVDCHFRGLMQKIFNLEKKASLDEIDMRKLGQIAHQVLELFFKPKIVKRENFNSIFLHVINKFKDKNYIAEPDIFDCQSDWLKDLLILLIEELSKDNNMLIFGLELAFGLENKGYPGVTIRHSEQEYLIGGVIDRVDRKNDSLTIIDYKMSSLDNLKQNSNNILVDNFQLAFYVRLIHDIFNIKNMTFSYASIRDSKMFTAFDSEKEAELFARIIDDSQTKSLSARLHDIFAPLKRGEALARLSNACEHCPYGYLCRRDEGASHDHA
jgi:ATP-dependent helicase/DNAse subunit B